jgi:para-nitrobenzyl esterase
VAPVRDGDVIAEDPLEAIGAVPGIDLLAGGTREEGLLYLAGVPGFDDMPAAVAEAFADRVSGDPESLLASLRAGYPDATPGELAAAVITEVAFRAPTERLLARHAAIEPDRTYAYEFAWRSSALGGRLGAAHAIDVPFAFDTLATPGAFGSDDAILGVEGGPPELAGRMHRAWVAFVTSGDPGWATYPHVEELDGAAAQLPASAGSRDAP